jgi:hypothetical protein
LGPSDADTKTVAKSAKKLPASDATKASDLNVSHWVAEGVQPRWGGYGVFTLTKKYKSAAKALAKKQVALAGARLANLLNAELK